MLHKVCVLCTKACKGINYMIEAYSKVSSLKSTFEHFKYTIGSIYVYLKYYVTIENSQDFSHIQWTISVLTTARHKIQMYMSTVTDRENNSCNYHDEKPPPLRDWLNDMIQYFDYATFIINTFVSVESKLQNAYNIYDDITDAKYNFAALNASICRDNHFSSEFISRPCIQQKCDVYFEELREKITLFTDNLSLLYEKKQEPYDGNIEEPNWKTAPCTCFDIY
jgi:hypothetical protein